MRIAIGTDHRGFMHKEYIKRALPTVNWLDVGCFSTDRCDYPPFAQEVVHALRTKTADLGVLLCGSGIGMSIAANRFSGIYAGLVWNTEVARMAREDDNVNILVLPSDLLGKEEAVTCITAWLEATFKGGRYQERLEMMDAYKE
jgi:ribose 5-phosphate isomerase B